MADRATRLPYEYEAVLGSFVSTGGIHGTGAGLVGSIAATTGYIEGKPVFQIATTITYLNTETTWVVMSQAVSGNLGTFTRVTGTKYLIDSTSASLPALPATCMRLMEVTTAGGAITVVTDQRPALTGTLVNTIANRGNPTGIDATGAIGANQTTWTDVSLQSTALWTIRYALKNKANLGNAQSSLRAFELGWRHQKRLGPFTGGYFDYPGVAPLTAIDADAFFIGEFAQWYYLARQSPFWEALRTSIRAIISRQLPSALGWLYANRSYLADADTNSPNRIFLASGALILGGQILQEESLRSRERQVQGRQAIRGGNELLAYGLTRQHASGYFIEASGSDTGYTAVSLMFLGGIHNCIRSQTSADTINTAIGACRDWIIPLINATTGEVDDTNNTRTADRYCPTDQAPYTFENKYINYSEVIYALELMTWAGFGSYATLADKVYDYWTA